MGLKENIFINNTAYYGKNYGSYPFMLGIIKINKNDSNFVQYKESTLKNLVSGEKLEFPLIIGLFD
jgi:hypothetical protein